MNERTRHLQAIATIIEDYQSGILAAPTSAHVERWVCQFPEEVQLSILVEMEHVLGKTYFSKKRVRKFMKSLIHHDGWTGGDADVFWRQVNFLNLQPRGNSQRDLISLFDGKLQKELEFSIAQCGQGNKFIYLDDGLFSGGRLGVDLKDWITNIAPQNAELYIAAIAIHTQGHYFTEKSLKEANDESGKNISIKWVRSILIEDGLFKIDTSDVLRPTGPGDGPSVAAYVASLGKEQKWRTGTSVGPLKFFSSNQGRVLLEQEFLKMGVDIRNACPNFNPYQRPLGNTTMKTIGFGTMFATYRNCPNNAPLVLWAGDPWYPLLRRATN